MADFIRTFHMIPKSNNGLLRDSLLATTEPCKLPRVEVRWLDAHAYGGWSSMKEYRSYGLTAVESIGYLVKNTKDEVQLVQSRSPRGNIADAISIPKKWLISAKYLSKPR